MSFRFSPGGQGQADPWFRVGRVDVSTTVFVVALSVLTMMAYPFLQVGQPPGQVHPLLAGSMMYPDLVAQGQVWRLVTWPLVNALGLFPILSLFFFWYFGTELESVIGRRRMAWLLTGYLAVLGVLGVFIGLFVAYGGLAGLDKIQVLVLLTWIGTYPTRRFFFNIPAWALGLVILVLQLIAPLASRDFFSVLVMLLGIPLCAVVARSMGLLDELPWIPSLSGRSGGAPPRAPRQRRRGRQRNRGRSGPQVVTGPWQGSSHTPTPRERDQARLDGLLDKISEQGMSALSEKEKKELLQLRERLSRG